jgi:hypothetical protein
MTGAESGVGHSQVLQGLNGGVNRVPTISLVGNGADDEDQTVAGESAGGNGSPMASKEMEVDTSDRNKGLETSPAWKGPIQSSMVTQGFLDIFPSVRPIWRTSTLTRMLSKVLRTPIYAVGVMGKHLCL